MELTARRGIACTSISTTFPAIWYTAPVITAICARITNTWTTATSPSRSAILTFTTKFSNKASSFSTAWITTRIAASWTTRVPGLTTENTIIWSVIRDITDDVHSQTIGNCSGQEPADRSRRPTPTGMAIRRSKDPSITGWIGERTASRLAEARYINSMDMMKPRNMIHSQLYEELKCHRILSFRLFILKGSSDERHTQSNNQFDKWFLTLARVGTSTISWVIISIVQSLCLHITLNPGQSHIWQ